MPLRKPTPSPKGETDVRAAILEVARGLFLRFGLRKTTMEDIAAAMGKRKSFLYYYFAGKQDVLTAVAEKEFADIAAVVHAAVEEAGDPGSRLRTYFIVRAQQIEHRLGVQGAWESGLSTRDDAAEILQLNEQRRSFDAHEEHYLASLLRDGIRSKAFRPMSDAEVSAFCRFVFAALRGLELEFIIDQHAAEGVISRLELTASVLLTGLLA